MERKLWLCQILLGCILFVNVSEFIGMYCRFMKHAASGTLEHLNHVIWGAKPLHMSGYNFSIAYDPTCMCKQSEELCIEAKDLSQVHHVSSPSDCDGHILDQ